MKNNNPLSPHIQIYNWHVSSLVSISHRISGVINYLFFIFLCIWISFVFLFGQHYNLFADFFNSIFGMGSFNFLFIYLTLTVFFILFLLILSLIFFTLDLSTFDFSVFFLVLFFMQ